VICEAVHLDVPWRQDCIVEGFVVEEEGRVVRPGTRPGLGIEINEAEVAKHPFEQEVLQRSFYRDGSVGDW
jgi:galactonate dehydratase